jgi:hypothetical protein
VICCLFRLGGPVSPIQESDARCDASHRVTGGGRRGLMAGHFICL